MKIKLRLFLLLFAIVFSSHGYGQCPTCKDALIKDFLAGATNVSEQLQVLHFIDKATYSGLKVFHDADSSAPLVSALISHSKDYEDFDKKREQLFEFAAYTPADENIETALRTTGGELWFTHYANCMDNCLGKFPDKIYAVLTRTDEAQFYVKVKFNAGTGSKVWVNASANGENAMVQKPDANYFTSAVQVRLNRGKEQEFVFKRSNRNSASSYKIIIDGKEIATGIVTYIERPQPATFDVSATITMKDSVKKFMREQVVTMMSPNLDKVMANDSLCRALKGSPKGIWCSVKNRMELPPLPPSKNMYYTNFSKPEPISTGKKEAAYGKFNKLGGLREQMHTTSGNKSAVMEFRTSSGNCEWQWKADIYEFTEKLSKVQKTIPVKNNMFSIEVPENSMDAVITIKFNGTKYELKPGSNNKDAKVYLLSSAKKHGVIKYEYVIVN